MELFNNREGCMKTYTIPMIFFLLISSPSALFAKEYRPWSEDVFTYVNEQYGERAEKRYRYLHKLILENQDKTAKVKLDLVNRTLNHLPWIADQQHWKSADYWATPLETIVTFGGDCEDIAIAKWLILRHLGVSKERLRLAYVKIKKTGEAHMILLYIDNMEGPVEQWTTLVLDNYVDEVKKGSDRPDLLAVYALSATGEIVLFADNGSEREIKGVYKDKKVRKLDELQKKFAEDMVLFRKLNGGYHPLLDE